MNANESRCALTVRNTQNTLQMKNEKEMTLSYWAKLYYKNGEITRNEKDRLLWEANHVADDLMDEDLFNDYIFEMRS